MEINTLMTEQRVTLSWIMDLANPAFYVFYCLEASLFIGLHTIRNSRHPDNISAESPILDARVTTPLKGIF